MTRKLTNLSDAVSKLNEHERAAWDESCKNAGRVFDALTAHLQRLQDRERKEMTLEKLLGGNEPVNILLARQAKVEALQDIIDLIVDK